MYLQLTDIYINCQASYVLKFDTFSHIVLETQLVDSIRHVSHGISSDTMAFQGHEMKCKMDEIVAKIKFLLKHILLA